VFKKFWFLVPISRGGNARFASPADAHDHGACVGHRSRKESIIGKFCNAWSYRMHVLCMNKLPLYFWKFSQHETFDCNLKVQKSNRCLV